jgi:cobalt-zinc-cadmium efflux system protein
MQVVPGVAGIHDLHVWALASSQPALTAHVVVVGTTDAAQIREQMGKMLDAEFHIEHVTLQMEAQDETCMTPGCEEQGTH